LRGLFLMKNTDIIGNSINRVAKGYIFTASSFKGEVKSLDAARKALSGWRMRAFDWI